MESSKENLSEESLYKNEQNIGNAIQDQLMLLGEWGNTVIRDRGDSILEAVEFSFAPYSGIKFNHLLKGMKIKNSKYHCKHTISIGLYSNNRKSKPVNKFFKKCFPRSGTINNAFK